MQYNKCDSDKSSSCLKMKSCIGCWIIYKNNSILIWSDFKYDEKIIYTNT